ncbi:MAG: chromate resistance protein [Actinobacteria bacterium]|nr:chromate resistance protein [Actinomycetota bacterium]
MKWATRPGIHIDRAACAWLIRRHVDPSAEFIFVDDVDDVPPTATAFDMRGVELSHHGHDCTFETILRRYALDDPVLWQIAAIVHEADLADDAHDAPEAAGFDLIVRALSAALGDERAIERTREMFDAVHDFLRQPLLEGGARP